MDKNGKDISLTIQMKTAYMFDFVYSHSYHGIQGIINYGFSLAALIALLCGFGKDNNVTTIALIVLAALFTVINPLLLYYKAARQVISTPMFQKPLTYTFDEEGFTVSQEGASARASWDDILMIRETGKIIALYMGASNATILPKKECGEQLEAVKELIRNAVPEVAKKLK